MPKTRVNVQNMKPRDQCAIKTTSPTKTRIKIVDYERTELTKKEKEKLTEKHSHLLQQSSFHLTEASTIPQDVLLRKK